MKFRAIDANAIEEVFVDNEYDFLKKYIISIDHPVVVDLGAHIGSFSIWALKNNRAAKVLSIEPDPDTFDILSENKLSALSYSPGITWEIHNLLAWSENNKIISFSQDGPSMSHRVDMAGNINVKTIDFETILKTSLINNGDIDLLKIDIEGSEEEFICKNPEFLIKVKCLVVELHPYLCNTDQVVSVIKKYFCNIIEIKNRNSSKPLLYCY